MTSRHAIAVCRTCRSGMLLAVRALLLTAALLAYGSIPRTAATPSEVESETLHETMSTTIACCELRRGMRHVSFREAIRSGMPAAHVVTSSATAARHLDASPHLSAGLTVPLRC